MTDKNLEQIEQAMTSTLQSIGSFIHQSIPEEWVFGVVICIPGESGSVIHVSNVPEGSMEDMLAVIEEWCAKMREGDFHDPDPTLIDGGTEQ